MEFRAKLDAGLHLLASTGMSRMMYAPPLFRLFWRLGIRLPPPLFLGLFGSLMVNALAVFLTVFGFSMAIVDEGSISAMLSQSAQGGVKGALIFAPVLAMYDRIRARNRGIPLWVNFNPTNAPPPDA